MPNSKLLEIANHCDLLRSSKVTEQDKGLKGLIFLLQDNEAVKSLNVNDCKDLKRRTTWNTVFNVLYEYLKRECDTLLRQHGSWAKTKQKNKIKKVQDLFNFVKTFIRVANSGSVRLKLIAFCNFLIDLWSKDIFVNNYDIVILKIISDSVIAERKYCCELSRDAFGDLFKICSQEFVLHEEKRKSSVSSLFLMLTRSLVEQMDADDCLHLHKIFVDTAKSLKLAKSSIIRNNILGALNLYIKWCSITYRSRCCQLGEECLDIILRIWMESPPTESTTLTLLTEFCSTQLSIHHPSSAIDESLGYYTTDEATWHRQLCSILITADAHLAKQQTGVLYRANDDKSIQFHEGCINLAADVCCVLFQLVSQEKYLGSISVLCSNASTLIAKIDFCDKLSILSLYTITKDKKITDCAKPWIQILSFLVQKHWKTFDFPSLVKIAAKFQSLFLNASMDSLGENGINLMSTVFNQIAERFHKEVHDHIEELSQIWKDCWAIASSCLTGTTRTDIVHSALRFMTSLIKFDASCRTNIFTTTGVAKSFHNTWSSIYLHIPPTYSCLELMVAFGQTYGLQCIYGDNAVFTALLHATARSTEFSECQPYNELVNESPLKALILHWLLGYKQEIAQEKYSRQVTSARLSAASQMNGREDNMPKPMILLNLLSGKHARVFESQTPEIVSLILSLLCRKNNHNAVKSDGNNNPKIVSDNIISEFLNPEFVAIYKYFNVKEESIEKHWISDNASLPVCSTSPLHKSVVEVVFHALQTDLNVLVETILDARTMKMSSCISRLCKSFFVIANTAGLFLKFVLSNDKDNSVALKFFEYWLQKTIEITEIIVSWMTLNSDKGFESEFFKDSESLTLAFYALEPQTNPDVFSCAKAIFESSMCGVFEKALMTLKCSYTETADNDEDSSLFSSHDQTLGLTQSVITHSSSSGNKRKRYGGGDAPPAKQKRYFRGEESSATESGPTSDILAVNPIYRRALSLLCTICKHFECADLLMKVVCLISELDPTLLQNLKIIYLICDQDLSFCGKLSMGGVADITETFKNIFMYWYRDQYISMKFLILLANLISAFDKHDMTEQPVFDALIEMTAGVLGIFWKLKNKKKCSHLVRMAIALCMFVLLKAGNNVTLCGENSADEMCFIEAQQALAALSSFLSDPNDGVKFLTTNLLRIAFVIKRDSSDFKALQDKLLSTVSGNLKLHVSNHSVSDKNIENDISVLSVLLHILCAILPYSNKHIEMEVHLRLCLLASDFQRIIEDTLTKKVVIHLVQRALKVLAMAAFPSMLYCAEFGENHIHQYMARHLQNTFYRLTEKCSGDIIQMMEAFPCQLFNAKSMQSLCLQYKKETVPVLLCRAKSVNELELIARNYYLHESCNQLEKGFLKDIASECAPVSLTFYLPTRPIPEAVAQLLNNVLCMQNAVAELCSLHLGRILVETLLKAVDENPDSPELTSALACLANFSQQSTKGAKPKQKSVSIVVAAAIFGINSNSCHLVQTFLCLREHFCKAQYPHEIHTVIMTYKQLVFILLGFHKVPDDLVAYVLQEISYTVAFHTNLLQERFSTAKARTDKEFIVKSTISCLDVLVSLCEFLNASTSAVVQRTIKHWAFAVPLACSLATLNQFFDDICKNETEQLRQEINNFKTKLNILASLMASVKSEVLHKTLVFCAKGETTADIGMSIEVFENAFTVLDDRDLLGRSHPLMNRILTILAKTLSSTSSVEQSMRIMHYKLQKIACFLLRMTHVSGLRVPSVFDCVIETFRLLPSDCQMIGKNGGAKTAQDLVIQILKTLSQLVVSDSHEISENASVSICRLLHRPNIASCWSQILVQNRFLADVLTTYKTKTTLSLVVESPQQGIEGLKNVSLSPSDVFTESHEKWIRLFTSTLVEFCSAVELRILKPVNKVVDKLSSLVLPSVIHDILVNDPTRKARTTLSSYLQTSFATFLDLYRESCHAVRSMQALLDVVQFLRSQSISEIEDMLCKRGKSSDVKKSTAWDNNFWLDINFLIAANVAVVCDRPFMAVMFSEIWTGMIETEKKEATVKKVKSSSCRSLLGALDNPGETRTKPTVFDQHQVGCNDLLNQNQLKSLKENILMQAFSKILDVDSLHGLRKGCTENSQLMMHIHEIECNWEDTLECYSHILDKSSYDTAIAEKIFFSLKYSGLDHIGAMYKKGTQSSCSDNSLTGTQNWLREKQYDAAFEAGKWTDTFSHKSCISTHNSNFHSKFYECIACVNDQDEFLPSLISDLRSEIASSISAKISCSNAWNRDMLSAICYLVGLKEVEDAYHLIMNKNSSAIPKFLQDWDKFFAGSESMLHDSYDNSDRIISNRHCLLSILMTKFMDENSMRILAEANEKHLSLQIKLASHGGRGKLALRKMVLLKQKILSEESQRSAIHQFKYYAITLQEAQLLWKLGRCDTALSTVEDLQSKLEVTLKEDASSRFEKRRLLSKILQLQGHWLDSTKMKGPSTIVEEYFMKSIGIADGLQKVGPSHPKLEELCCSGYESLAKFADAQYQEVINYMRSSEFEQKRNLVREAQEEMKRAQSKSSLGQNQKYVILLQKTFKIDHADFNDILERKEKFLLCALENYVKCLSLTDKHDILMYRICSLWFTNAQSSSLPGLMECACKALKTHKFVEMSYQLAARLNAATAADRTFQGTLSSLLCRVATDHPYHVLPVLLALANAHKDAEFTKSSSKKSSAHSDPTSLSARSIVDQVKKQHPQLVTLMGDLSTAYIQLANWDVSRYSKTTGVPISFEKNLLINRYIGSQIGCKYLALAVPTVDIPISKVAQYEDKATLVSLRSFKNYFNLCGGMNLPKIVIAIGSDGTERKHLVKGRDDLRQDSVMEQVFKVVNALLAKEKDSKGLKLCTYKVVPLSQRSGLVEWCEGTMPIGNYLIGVPVQKNYGAHHRYRPKDLISLDCRKKLSSSSGKPLHQKLTTYKDICENFKPVFRHFFYEKFTEPTNWFQCRTAYCKSVAASSIVGYILGLGDRHVQNILIDCTSGEVIHIDLGVAFEQGKCLPTPEMVPFRLTQDIVDGFGSSGVEGLFRRNCERTLSVLRKSIDIISTIVEVLLHDPLHDWMMTSSKALQVQRHNVTNTESEMTSSILNASTVAELLHNETSGASTTTSRSSLAGRALFRVQEKLRGLESGSVLSVEGQVNLLIQQAIDEERLCAMYAGWQPYI